MFSASTRFDAPNQTNVKDSERSHMDVYIIAIIDVRCSHLPRRVASKSKFV